jgi:hypothetical protein
MRLISEKAALERLDAITQRVRSLVRDEYEHRAESCITCSTPGACCLDAHFVNVRISRLEAIRIRRTIDRLPGELRTRVQERIRSAVDTYHLDGKGEAAEKKYACPLFEKGTGCLVHETGKPIPCIVHACYEDPKHLPPETVQTEAEGAIDRLNRKTYGRSQPQLPIPLAISR